jgi:putative ABC transport system substrate-binding protein
VPQINRVGILLNPLNPVWDGYPGVLANAAEALRLDLVRVEARGVAELEQAFATMAAQGVDALFGLDDSTLAGAIPQPASLMKLLAAHRLPSISDAQGFGRAGGLLALEPDTADITRGAALYVQRILQGAKVSDLPVVHPATFKLVVNLRTAQQLGITIPPSILLRADEVIE